AHLPPDGGGCRWCPGAADAGVPRAADVPGLVAGWQGAGLCLVRNRPSGGISPASWQRQPRAVDQFQGVERRAGLVAGRPQAGPGAVQGRQSGDLHPRPRQPPVHPHHQPFFHRHRAQLDPRWQGADFHLGPGRLAANIQTDPCFRATGTLNIPSHDFVSGDFRILTNTYLDESPTVAPNGAMLLYATKRGTNSLLAAVSIDAGVKFLLPAREGDVREPAWSPFLN